MVRIMSNICATILAIASLIGIFVAVAIDSTGIMVFLCVIFTLLCTDAVRQKKEDVEDQDEEVKTDGSEEN